MGGGTTDIPPPLTGGGEGEGEMIPADLFGHFLTRLPWGYAARTNALTCLNLHPEHAPMRVSGLVRLCGCFGT